jgi:hypothetical protein
MLKMSRSESYASQAVVVVVVVVDVPVPVHWLEERTSCCAKREAIPRMCQTKKKRFVHLIFSSSFVQKGPIPISTKTRAERHVNVS